MTISAVSFKSNSRACRIVTVLLTLVCFSELSCRRTGPKRLPVEVPGSAAWMELNHGDLSGEIPVTIQVICGPKWRVEFGRKQHPGVAVFDGKSFQANFPGQDKDSLDPHKRLQWFQKDLLHPTSVEVVEKDGTKLTAYHCNDAKSVGIVYVDFFTKRPVRVVGREINGADYDVEYQFLDYDVKGHEEELFDTENLKSYFSDHLLLEGPLSGSASAH